MREKHKQEKNQKIKKSAKNIKPTTVTHLHTTFTVPSSIRSCSNPTSSIMVPPCASLSRQFGCCVACTRLLLLAISLDYSLLFLSGDRFFLRWVMGFPQFHLLNHIS
jgi:hypothetical protein